MNLKDAGIYDLSNIFKGKSSELHSQGGIINSKSRLINIPAYQRPYRWTSKYIIQVFEDFDDNSEEYFLGSAVLVEKNREETIFDVVDGQQRITTLYLINYIRYLLKKEYVYEKISKSVNPGTSEYLAELKECYCDLIGRKSAPFDMIKKKMKDLSEKSEEGEIEQDDYLNQLALCYKEQLCIPELKDTPEETRIERLKKAHEFFDNEQLCLKYSRPRYDNVLKDALCSVFIKQKTDTTQYELEILEESEKDSFSENYLNALKTIFSEIWNRAEKNVDDNASLMDKCEKAIELLDSIIKNMSLCIVLTENEDDANKLFEVLNDRALDVEDLELIKNHFYKEYCTKSDDSDEDKDKRITELDEMWVDKIFDGCGLKKSKRISYLAAVYFTCDKDLSFKDDSKLKNAINRNYTARLYAKDEEGKEPYSYEKILEDFNIYYAIRLINDLFELQDKEAAKDSLEAEQKDKSITYKTFHLLHAMDLPGVMAALVNVIIAHYSSTHSMISSSFKEEFSRYINELIDDSNHEIEDYRNVHNCAYVFWIASIKGKDYKSPRNIARRIIEKYGKVGYCPDDIDLTHSEMSDLDKEFDEWLDNWNYKDKKTFSIKILLINLLLSQRVNATDESYKSKTDKLLVKSALCYTLDAKKLQLDHLEANKVLEGTESCYYLSDDKEKRQNDVNGYIGNFMILDAADNNSKNNVPLCKAIEYYSKIKESWLVQDILNMINDEKYYDLDNNVPKEEFFKERSRRLKKYFKILLNRKLDDKEITVSF